MVLVDFFACNEFCFVCCLIWAPVPRVAFKHPCADIIMKNGHRHLEIKTKWQILGGWWAWDEPFSVCQEHCCPCSWGDPSLTLCTSCPGAQRNPWKAHIGMSVTWQSIIVVNSTCKERYDLQYVGIGVPAKKQITLLCLLYWSVDK